MSPTENVASDIKTAITQEALIPFEQWAGISARLLKRSRDERLDILDAAKVDPLDWLQAEQHWVATLADDLDRGEDERINHYAKVCSEELQRRGLPETVDTMVPAEAAPPDAPPSDAPSPAIPSPDAPPPAIPSPARFDLTAPALVMPIPRQALPFGDKPALDLSKPSPPRPMPEVQGDTLPLQVNMMEMALPFMKNQRGGSGTKTAPPNAPAMTLDAYASLCAELLAQPARRPDVLQRYQIADETALNELHAFWQKQFAKEPRLHAEWQSKCEAFRDWLTHKR